MVAVSDLDPALCRALQERTRAKKAYPTFEELLKHAEEDRVEAVYIATDAPSHVRLAIMALEHGLHVASAVPAFFGADQLEMVPKLVDAVKASGRLYMMNETTAFRPEGYAMRKLYEAGMLGDVVYTEGEYYHPDGNDLDSVMCGSFGVWNVPANWQLTTAGSLAPTQPAGYPVFGSTAVFATAEGAGPITVTVPATAGTTRYSNENRWWVSALNLDGMHEELVFTSEDKTAANCRFSVYSVIANQTWNRLVFDDCNVWINGVNNAGATAADANGENLTVTMTGGTTAQFNGFTANRPGVKVRVEDGATLNAGGLTGGSAAPPPVLEIDGGTVTAGKLEPDTWSSVNGTMVRLVGADITQIWYRPPPHATVLIVK